MTAIDVRDDAPVGAGEYRHVTTRAWWSAHMSTPDGKPFVCLYEQLLTEWVPTDPSDDWMWDRRTTGRHEWLAGDEERARAQGLDTGPRWPTGRWRAAYGDYFAAGSGRPARPRDASWDLPAPEFLAELPREPDLLRDRLLADTGPRHPLATARTLLASGQVPADLRGSLYAVLRTLPGIVVAAAGNADGEPGVAFVADDGPRRQEVVVDPDGGGYLGERQTMLVADFGLAEGAVVSATAVTVGVAPGIGEPASQ
ncbi:hypothetical protein WIS52_11240 [Pseudonocardia nematodicida]|uniref:Uncharacterized protein n=1 Tax=Pseudonocardia nematodicida TaxID=1206997 RepID=A0ABV1KA68_9PSEU